jgi:NADP-dependent aldehyde dehydrogenase
MTETSRTFTALDPRTGAPLAQEHREASSADVDAALTAAAAAAPQLAALTLDVRAALLDAVADALDADADLLVASADSETALGAARLTGELARTTGQLRAFADVVREGAHLGVVIDHADPTATPPRPDLRRTMVPLGPVVVFGASNFPLAFGVAGGDTASALAAGCPVVAKAHPSNAGTSALVAAAVVRAVAGVGLPPGTFTVLQGAGDAVGAALVTHPATAAVGFTGSLRGGRALFDLAAGRAEPIPVHAEMGSHNPVWVTPAALSARGTAIAEALGASATMGVGQFCTKPSVVFVPDDARRADRFIATLAATVAAAPLGPMLDPRIRASFVGRSSLLAAIPGVVDATLDTATLDTAAPATVGPDATGPVRAAVLDTDLATWAREDVIREECFGPSIVVVRCTTDELVDSLATVPGGLTASVWSEPSDPEDRTLAMTLIGGAASRVGRVLHDGVPTGVAVSWAQQHGGPYPATTTPGSTSVGMHAVDRFLRPVAYQDLPDTLLPVWLRDDDPWGLPRRVDGVLRLPSR